jgi:hypothetical protein
MNGARLVWVGLTGIVVLSAAFTVAGRMRADAVVSINDAIVEPGLDGRFSLDLVLDEGPTVIEVMASIATGAQLDEVLTVIFAP